MFLRFPLRGYKNDLRWYHLMVHPPHQEHKLEQGLIKILQKVVIKRLVLVRLQTTDLNFEVGMIFKTSSTNSYAMIVPSDWNNDYLPKNKDIKLTDNVIKIDNIISDNTISNLKLLVPCLVFCQSISPS